MEIVKIVLLDDIGIIFFCQLEQAAFFLHGIGNACRGLIICHHINKARMIQLEEVFQNDHIHAILLQRNLYQLAPTGQKCTRCTVKRGLFHKNNIPIAQHRL